MSTYTHLFKSDKWWKLCNDKAHYTIHEWMVLLCLKPANKRIILPFKFGDLYQFWEKFDQRKCLWLFVWRFTKKNYTIGVLVNVYCNFHHLIGLKVIYVKYCQERHSEMNLIKDLHFNEEPAMALYICYICLLTNFIFFPFVIFQIFFHLQSCSKVYIPPDIFLLNAIVNKWCKI